MAFQRAEINHIVVRHGGGSFRVDGFFYHIRAVNVHSGFTVVPSK